MAQGGAADYTSHLPVPIDISGGEAEFILAASESFLPVPAIKF